MAQEELPKSMKLVSASKITSSRILKYTLIVIGIVAILYLVSLGAIYTLSLRALGEGITNEQVALIEKIADFIKISPETTIVALATTTVLRYLTREVSSNITGKNGSILSTTEDKE